MKNLYITISPKSGLIVKNPNFSLKNVQKIVESKAKWIYTKLEEIQNKYRIKDIYEKEGKVLYLGKKMPIHVDKLETFYRENTKKIILNEIESISTKMQLKPTKVSFRKTKRRWGSCNSKDELSFTISIAQLPLEYIKYIIVHELSHILHKNHKKVFYQTVEKYVPNFKAIEKSLKSYSPSLD